MNKKEFDEYAGIILRNGEAISSLKGKYK